MLRNLHFDKTKILINESNYHKRKIQEMIKIKKIRTLDQKQTI